jgi:hypothetical protein
MSRSRAGEMPMDWAATSLPRTAASVLPNVPDWSADTIRATITSTTTASTRNDLSLAKSIGPSVGRGTTVLCSTDTPPLTQLMFTSTASKK